MDGDAGCLILFADLGTFSSLLFCSFRQTTSEISDGSPYSSQGSCPSWTGTIFTFTVTLKNLCPKVTGGSYLRIKRPEPAADHSALSNSKDDKNVPPETSYSAAICLRYDNCTVSLPSFKTLSYIISRNFCQQS
jgi:hypothetical protein